MKGVLGKLETTATVLSMVCGTDIAGQLYQSCHFLLNLHPDSKSFSVPGSLCQSIRIGFWRDVSYLPSQIKLSVPKPSLYKGWGCPQTCWVIRTNSQVPLQQAWPFHSRTLGASPTSPGVTACKVCRKLACPRPQGWLGTLQDTPVQDPEQWSRDASVS